MFVGELNEGHKGRMTVLVRRSPGAFQPKWNLASDGGSGDSEVVHQPRRYLWPDALGRDQLGLPRIRLTR